MAINSLMRWEMQDHFLISPQNIQYIPLFGSTNLYEDFIKKWIMLYAASN